MRWTVASHDPRGDLDNIISECLAPLCCHYSDANGHPCELAAQPLNRPFNRSKPRLTVETTGSRKLES